METCKSKQIYLFGNSSGSQSQNALYTAVNASICINDHKGILIGLRSDDEILADELPVPDAPDAMEKTAIRSQIQIYIETTHTYSIF